MFTLSSIVAVISHSSHDQVTTMTYFHCMKNLLLSGLWMDSHVRDSSCTRLSTIVHLILAYA